MTTVTDASRAGTETAQHLTTALADAGMTAERADRFDQLTPVSDQFCAAFDRAAATCVAELRDLEAG